MGVKHVAAFLGVPPARLLDGELSDIGIEMIDLDKLERLVLPRAGESIADAVLRRHGRIAEQAISDNFKDVGKRPLGSSATAHSSLLTPNSALPEGGAE